MQYFAYLELHSEWHSQALSSVGVASARDIDIAMKLGAGEGHDGVEMWEGHVGVGLQEGYVAYFVRGM